MAKKAYQSYSTKRTPQSQPIPGSGQVQNNAGGYTWGVDKWERLHRFLILGSEGGTYYVSEQDLTKRNADSLLECIKENGKRVVDMIVDISDSGRAFRNDPALFALAVVASFGSDEERKYALDNLPKVARIPTHLYSFITYADQFRGWGRGMRTAVDNWLTSKSPSQLAYHAVKYQQRGGWSMRDVLRKAHPSAKNDAYNKIYNWIVNGWESVPESPPEDNYMSMIWAHERAKLAQTDGEIIALINDYGLVRESIPTQWLNSSYVWEALLVNMPITAMIRNLGKMTNIGLISPMSDAAKMVAERVTDTEILKGGRVHPMSILMAMKIYADGRGMRGSLTWSPVREVVDALDQAFYLSFGNVEPIGNHVMLALDVSPSMGSSISGTPLSCMEASAAMALVTANVEKSYLVTAFAGFGLSRSSGGAIKEFPLSPRQRLDDVLNAMHGFDWGGTDCALPMLYAEQKEIRIDTFVVYTDNETWAGNIHPAQALRQYRKASGLESRLAVVGMVSNGFSIADPKDRGMMDFVGFDVQTPNVISAFARGEV